MSKCLMRNDSLGNDQLWVDHSLSYYSLHRHYIGVIAAAAAQLASGCY
jgi:hypothetical protein